MRRSAAGGAVVAISFLLGLAQSQEDERHAHQPGLDSLFVLAQHAADKRDFVTAEGILTRILSMDSLFRDRSGKSAWYLAALLREKRGERRGALRTLERGHGMLEGAALSDPYLDFHLARILSEVSENPDVRRITELVYSTLSRANPREQPDLWSSLRGFFGQVLRDPLQAPSDSESSRLSPDPIGALKRHNPYPARLENPFVLQTISRSVFARSRFPDPTYPRGYDDRGETFVLLGEPEIVIADHSGVIGSVGGAVSPFEVWFYPSVHHECYFTFEGKAGKSHFVLVDGPESIFGTFYRGRTSMFDRRRAGKTATDLRFEVYFRLSPIHPEFRHRVEELERAASYSEAYDAAVHRFPAADRAHREFVDSLLGSAVLGRDDASAPLSASFDVFRTMNRAGSVRTTATVAVPFDEISFTEASDTLRSTLQLQVAVFDSMWNVVGKDSASTEFVRTSLPAPGGRDAVLRVPFDLGEGGYELLVRVENNGGEKATVFRRSIDIEPFPADRLSLSDIQFGLDEPEAEQTGRQEGPDWFFHPVVGDEIENGVPLFFCLESYNLAMGPGGSASCEIAYSIRREKSDPGFFETLAGLLWPGDGESQVLGGSIRRRTPNHARLRVWLQVPAEDLEPGSYVLRLDVEDTVSHRRAHRERSFTIRR